MNTWKDEVCFREYILFGDEVIGRERSSDRVWVGKIPENKNLVGLGEPITTSGISQNHEDLFEFCQKMGMTSWVGNEPRLDHMINVEDEVLLETGYFRLTCSILDQDFGQVGVRIFENVHPKLVKELSFAKCNQDGLLEFEQY